MFSQIAEKISTPLSPFIPCKTIQDRPDWQSLPEELKRKAIASGEAYLGYAYPSLQATEYMEFSRTGDRERYQKKLFDKRIALNNLVLAECVEARGRFLDDIVNGIFSICEETAWQLPAHNSYIRDTPQLPLPDVTRPVVDLFAAETGAVLAVTQYLLKDVLEQISPVILTLIHENLEKRIFTPYLSEHFWWMGDGKGHMNNWTVWCTQNVLLAAYTSGLPKEIGLTIFQKACKSLDYFLDEYGEDGCCEEGAQYYRHAGLCLFNNLEILNGITNGSFCCLYQETKIRNIAEYILNAHIDGIYYVNFADCSPVAGRCNAREFLFGKRTDNPDLMAFAAKDYKESEDPMILTEHNLFYRIQMMFTHEEMMNYPTDTEIVHRDFYYPSVGLFAARDEHLYLSVKAGDNDDSHNHNDTGSFTVYKDGKPMFIDIGVENYTKKTFSPQRYEIWTMQSQYHNLPTIGGVMQMDGEEFRAKHVEYSLGDKICRISMDIGEAYPDLGIISYCREAVLEKGVGITVTDTYHGEKRPVVLSLMTYEKPEICGNTMKIGELGSCVIDGASDVLVEMLPIEDSRLKTAWEHEVYRTLVTMGDNRVVLRIE